MKLIVGLGNPGGEYQKNRHNVGYMLVDEINNIEGFVAKKTNSFMNVSGDAVAKLVKKYSVSMDDLYVAHDDLDIALGEFKIQKARGPKDHNGIISVENSLDTQDFWRIRIGVENRGSEKISGEEYVLQDFAQEEKKIIKSVFDKIKHELKRIR